MAIFARLSLLFLLLPSLTTQLYAEAIDMQSQFRITMNIANVTCVINQGKGISQNIFMPLLSFQELREGHDKWVNAPLILDCSQSASDPESVELTVMPSNGSRAFGDGSQGKLLTDKEEIALQLRWRINGNPVLLNNEKNIFTPEISTSKIWDLSIKAKTILVNEEIHSGGMYNGTIIININYT